MTKRELWWRPRCGSQPLGRYHPPAGFRHDSAPSNPEGPSPVLRSNQQFFSNLDPPITARASPAFTMRVAATYAFALIHRFWLRVRAGDGAHLLRGVVL